MATRRDLRFHLSAASVRARTAQTRPSLIGTRYDTREVGLCLGRDRATRQELWGSVEDSRGRRR